MADWITDSEAARNLPRYLDRVARGERFVVTRRGEPVAELSPVRTGMKVRDLPAFFASLPPLTPEEAAAFADDVERARAELPPVDHTDTPVA
jgi:prevent-host-death family protein